MADVVQTQGLGRQVWLVARLRWKLFRNSLRSSSARMDLLGMILAGGIFGFFALAGGIGMGALSYAASRDREYALLLIPLWIVVFFWQVFPVLMAANMAGFEYRRLLRFPLRFSSFFVLSLAYGLFDPSTLASLLWLLAMAAGILFARPELWRVVALALGAFLLFNLVFNRMIFAWLERLLSRRRSREAMAALFLLLMLSFQLFASAGSRWQGQLRPYVHAAAPYLRQLPPNLTRGAIEAAARGQTGEVANPILLLAAYALACSLLLHWRLRAQYRGEDLQESAAPAVATAVRSTARPAVGQLTGGLLDRIVPGPLAALLRREYLYLIRNSATGLTLLVPLVILLGLALTWSAPRPRGPGFFARTPEMAFPAAVAYMMLIISQYALNSFAYEGSGAQLFYLAPVRFRYVLMAKNIFLGSVYSLEAFLLWIMTSLTFRPPSLFTLAGTAAGLLFMMLVYFLVGNWLSLKYPRRFEFGQYRRRASGMTILISFGLQILVLAMAAGVLLLARALGRMWLVPVIFGALAAAALQVYMTTLESYSDLALRQRESLMDQLGRPRG